MLIALKGGHIQGSLLYQCTLNQLKVSLGEGFTSDFKFPSPKLTSNYYLYFIIVVCKQVFLGNYTRIGQQKAVISLLLHIRNSSGI